MTLRFVSSLRTLFVEELKDLFLRRRALFSLIIHAIILAVFVTTLSATEKRILPQMEMFQEGSPQRQALMARVQEAGVAPLVELLIVLGSLPGPAVMLQVLSLFWFPTLVALVSADMVSTDLGRGTLRYLVTRTSRTTYFLSKLLAHFFLYFVMHLFTFVALYYVCAYSAGDFNSARYIHWLTIYFAVFLPYLWLTVAVTIFISCATSDPAKSVRRVHLLWFIFLALIYFAPEFTPLNGRILLGYLRPTEGRELYTAWTTGCWALLFTVLGLVVLKRRML